MSTRLLGTFFTLFAFIFCALPLCRTAVCGPARLNPILSFGKVYQAVKIAPKKSSPEPTLKMPIATGTAPANPIVPTPAAKTITTFSGKTSGTKKTVQPVKIQPSLHPPRQHSQSDPYHIGIGDILTISVWQNPDLTRHLTVLPDGKIHFPLSGSVTAQGQTISELSNAMHEKLKPFVLNPELTVTVDKARSMVIYVIGKVNRPGSFDISEPVDVLQAISMAGGINPFADKDEIRIFRGSKNQTQIFPFDYSQVTKGSQLIQNILLNRGDVIVVP